MFQMQIGVDNGRKAWLSRLEDSLCDYIKNNSAVTAHSRTVDRTIFSLGLSKSSEVAREEIRDIIKNFYLTDVKGEYLMERVKEYSDNEYLLNVYVRILKEFNRSEEQRMIEDSLVLYQNFALDGFYNFSITGLKRMWHDLVLLTQDNADLIRDESSFRLLLKYMLSCLPSKTEEVSIDFSNKEFSVLSDGKEHMCKTAQEVVYLLIDLAPKKILLTHSAASTELDELIFSIFDAKKV